MRSQYFIPILIFFPLLLIQTTIMPFIQISGVVPDLILILLVFYSINNNQIYGTVLGFIFGFLFDIIAGILLGSGMISKTIAGFTAGYFSSETKRDVYLRSFSFSLIVLLCSFIDSILYSFFSASISAADISTNLILLFFEQGMLPGFYTAIISLIIVFFSPRRGLK